MQKINLFEMTRPEVEQALAAGVDTVIVPLGSTEQHGRHLPLGTDAILGQALGDRVARALGNALLAPGLLIGCSEHHMDFAGSLTLGVDNPQIPKFHIGPAHLTNFQSSQISPSGP